MAGPDKDAVLQAMRSDLGVSRIDDLELEDGRQGRPVKAGQANRVIPTTAAVAPPRNPLPLASRWKAAIEKGVFDDDDAEVVKGLDRIAGGRLHAQKAAALFPPPPPLAPPAAVRRGLKPHHGPATPGLPAKRRVFWRALRENGMGKHRAPVSFPLPPPRGAPSNIRSASVFGNSPGYTPTRHAVQHAGPRPSMAGGPGSAPLSRPKRTRPPTPPADSHGRLKWDDPDPTPKQPTAANSFPDSQEPEPTEHFYKADIHVADRKAKGKGAVYLLTASPTDAGTVTVYLEGLKYVEYPVLSMFNYITTATKIYPQFKEADGISITTTSLVFGSQDKIAQFMKAVKTLQARGQSQPPASTANQNSAPISSSTVSPTGPPKKPANKPAPPRPQISAGEEEICARIASLTLDHTPGANGTGPSTEKPRQTSNGHGGAGKEKSALMSTGDVKPPPGQEKQTSSPQEAQGIPSHGGDALISDLVDLSQPEETDASSGPPCSTGRRSSYVMDLESLCSPVAAPPGFSTLDAGTSTGYGIPESSPKTPTAGERNGMDSLSLLIPSFTDASPPSLLETAERVESSLLDIIPTFEYVSQLLSFASEHEREKIAEYIFAGLRQNGGKGKDGEDCLSSAKHLLVALLARSGEAEMQNTAAAHADWDSSAEDTAADAYLSDACRADATPTQEDAIQTEAPGLEPPNAPSARKAPRYTRTDLMWLRENAIPPPQQVLDLATLACTSSNPPATTRQPNKLAGSTDEQRRKNWVPTAPPFQPGNAGHTVHHQKSNSSVSHPSVAATPGNSPTATRALRQPEAKASSPVKKGLGGSRWATNGASARLENDNQFTGIDIPR